jgi:ribosomal protein S4E
MITTFELQDGTKINISDDKQYRIGLSIDLKYKYTRDKSSSKYIETFYLLSPNEIKKHIKKYDGELVYVVEM